MKTILFVVCCFFAVCSMIFAYAVATEASSAWRWMFVIPGIIAAIAYSCWSWHFRPWHQTYAC